MKYFISAFLPFMAFFYIKKPIYGYISLLFFLIAMVSWTIYPSALLLAITYVVLLMWSFFEINDYHSKLIAKKMIGYIREVNPSIGYDDEDSEESDEEEEEEEDSRPNYVKYLDKPIPLQRGAKNWQNNSKNNLAWPNQKNVISRQEENDDNYSEQSGLRRQPSRSRASLRGNNQEQATPVRYGRSSRTSYSSRGGIR